jgi:hypothetical protein
MPRNDPLITSCGCETPHDIESDKMAFASKPRQREEIPVNRDIWHYYGVRRSRSLRANATLLRDTATAAAFGIGLSVDVLYSSFNG